MKVVFLDFNGVLDTNERMDEIDSGNLKRLKQIIDETDSKVVITSSLKNIYYYMGYYSNKFKSIIHTLMDGGIPVIDMTKLGPTREEEIIKYLDEHPEVDNYCIIDDDYDMPKLSEHLVKLPMQGTPNQMGLTDEYMNMAISILKDRTLQKLVDKKNLN